MSSNLRWRKREAWGVRGCLLILKQYCYKILTKTTTIIECENRAHPTRFTLLLKMLDLQGLPVPPTLNLPKRLVLRVLRAISGNGEWRFRMADDLSSIQRARTGASRYNLLT